MPVIKAFGTNISMYKAQTHNDNIHANMGAFKQHHCKTSASGSSGIKI